jgi:hypothetical protein
VDPDPEHCFFSVADDDFSSLLSLMVGRQWQEKGEEGWEGVGQAKWEERMMRIKRKRNEKGGEGKGRARRGEEKKLEGEGEEKRRRRK